MLCPHSSDIYFALKHLPYISIHRHTSLTVLSYISEFTHASFFDPMCTRMYLISPTLNVRITRTHSILQLILSPIDISFIMPNEYFSDSPSGASDVSQSHNEETTVGFAITPQDSGILQEYLEEFQVVDTGVRTRMIERIVAELYLLWPANVSFDKMEASKVCGIYSFIILFLIFCSRKYRNGSTTTTLALSVTTPSLLGSGLPEMPFIT